MNDVYEFYDLDGTIFRFHDEVKYIERMYEEGFFKNLKPFQPLVDAINERISEGKNVYFLTAVIDSKFCESEKIEALKSLFPSFKAKMFIPVKMGENKFEKVKSVLGDVEGKRLVLFDDYNKNLAEWKGVAVKVVNNINDRGTGLYGGEKGNLWQGERIHNESSLVYSEIETACDKYFYALGDDKTVDRLSKLNVPFEKALGKNGTPYLRIDKQYKAQYFSSKNNNTKGVVL